MATKGKREPAGRGLGWRRFEELKPCNPPLACPSTLSPDHAGRDDLPGNPFGNDANPLAEKQRKGSADFHAPDGEVNHGGLVLHTEALGFHHEPDWNSRRRPL